MQNELFRNVVILAGNWTLVTVTRATALPCNKCDDHKVSIERGGVELVFSRYMSGSRQVIDGVRRLCSHRQSKNRGNGQRRNTYRRKPLEKSSTSK